VFSWLWLDVIPIGLSFLSFFIFFSFFSHCQEFTSKSVILVKLLICACVCAHAREGRKKVLLRIWFFGKKDVPLHYERILRKGLH